MAAQLKAVLAGCGSMSEVWLKVIAAMSDVQMVGFVDVNRDAAQKSADVYGAVGAIVGTELEVVLYEIEQARGAVDMVLDCTIPDAHHSITLTALSHGCHVLGEKPLASSMEQAREMVAAARDSGKRYAVVQNRRYDPNIRRLKALIDAGTLGTLTTLNSDFYIGAHFGGFRDHMEHVLLLDMAIHTFDAARYLCGGDPVSVYCKEWNPAGSWYDHDASAIAIFEMSNGVVYTYRGSWCSEGLPTTWECDWRLIGQRGSVTWDGAAGCEAQVVSEPGGFISKYDDVALPENVLDARIGGHAGVITEFIECVKNGGTPETTAEDNIKSLAMVFAAIESAEAGRPVPVIWS